MGDRDVERVDYDAELRLHHEALRRAFEIAPGDRLLDIGCGAGQTTREAARLAPEGWAVGVDISEGMIRRARSLAEAEGIRNVSFEQADAEVHRFLPGHFDLVISRFGTMFFRDPVAAFTNVGRGVRPDGRLLMMVWQADQRNAWSVAIDRALAATAGSSPPIQGLDPFSLADPVTVQRILESAGFTDVALTEVDAPVFFGRDVAAALEWVGGFSSTRDALARLDATDAELALGRLRETIAAHARDDGVWFDSRSWIVRARRT